MGCTTLPFPAIFLTLLFYKSGCICRQNLNLILDPDGSGDKPTLPLREDPAAGWSPNREPLLPPTLYLCAVWRRLREPQMNDFTGSRSMWGRTGASPLPVSIATPQPPLIAGGAAHSAGLLNRAPQVSSREVSGSLSKVLLCLLFERRLWERGLFTHCLTFLARCAHHGVTASLSSRSEDRREKKKEVEIMEIHRYTSARVLLFSLARPRHKAAHCVGFLLSPLDHQSLGTTD